MSAYFLGGGLKMKGILWSRHSLVGLPTKLSTGLVDTRREPKKRQKTANISYYGACRCRASNSTTRPMSDRSEPLAEIEPPTPIPGGALANGAAVIAAQLPTLPGGPGVYRMLNRKGDALY